MEEENKNPASTQEGETQTQVPPEGEQQHSNEEGSVESGKAESEENSSKTTKTAEEQSKEENAKFAKMRHEKEVAKAKAAGDAEGYKRARIKSVGGKNPYSGDSLIESDEDYELYELQDELKQSGRDPTSVLEVEKLRREKNAAKAKEIEEAKTQKRKDQERADKEVKEYLQEGHTNEELNSYWSNSMFQKMARPLLGEVPLKKIIELYDNLAPYINDAKKKSDDKKKEVANNISSPGNASNQEANLPTKSISKMTKEEFQEFRKGVSSGKIKL